MTEARWLACRDPQDMLEYLIWNASHRKLRLFACACVRFVWHFLEDDRSKEAVEVTEIFVDGIGHPEDWKLLCERAAEAAVEFHDRRNKETGDLWYAQMHAAFAVEHATTIDNEFETHMTEAAESVLACSRYAGYQIAEPEALVALLRDIFGNPFRPIAVNPTWLTSTVFALVNEMYESRDFSPMPILADALQDAGCDNDDILNHCRQPGEHARGCWVVDLILGKK